LTKGCASPSGRRPKNQHEKPTERPERPRRPGFSAFYFKCNLIASDDPAEVATAVCAILIIEPKNPPELVKSATANRTALVTFRATAGECPRLPQ
jgi:hypothetical protein